MNVNKKKALSVSRLSLLAVAIGTLTACGGGNSGMKLGDDEFTVQAVSMSSSEQTTQYPATLKGFQDVEIRPQVSGFITKLLVDEGATVRRGQALFQIDATQYTAAAAQARAGVASAQAALQTQVDSEKTKRSLHEQKIISDFEYQTAVNNLEAARAALAQAQASLVAANQNVGFCTVTSPSDGVVGTFPYRVGSLVSPSISQPMTTVSQIGSVYAYFSMTEKELLSMTKTGVNLKEQLSKMPAVRLQLADGTMYAEEGHVDAVSGVIDPTTGSVSMRALFRNPQNTLRSGGTANVIFPYTMADVIVVPQSATQEIQNKKFVFVLQKDSTVKHTEVTVANLNDGKNYIVTSGLQANDKIVVEGIQLLVNGQKIIPITAKQKAEKFAQHMKDQREGNLATAFQ